MTFIKYEPRHFSEDLALGVAGSTVSLPAGFAAMKTSECFLEKWGLKNAETQSFFPLYESLSEISNKLLRGVLKALCVVYITLFIPIVEEWFFRSYLYQLQESANTQEESLWSKVYRVFSNALVFSAIHYSFVQGWANIPILVVTTVVGVVFATLREISKSWRASAVAHCLNNSFMMMTLFLKA